MALVRILAYKLQPIVTDIGAVMSHSCLRFLYGFPSPSGNWLWFGDSRHGFERSCYFRAKSLAKPQCCFWVISVDVKYIWYYDLN